MSGFMNTVRDHAPHSIMAQLLTTPEAAKYIGITYGALMQRLRVGTGPKYYREDGGWSMYFKPAELDAYMEARA